MNSCTVHDSRAIAWYFVNKAKPATLDSLQVMKLVYIANGFVLGYYGHPLLKEDIEAWEYGPVVRNVYLCLQKGRYQITDEFDKFQLEEEIDPPHKEILDFVFDNFGEIKGLTLSSLAHGKDSPWEKTWETYRKPAVIPQEFIKEHYETIIKVQKEGGVLEVL